MLLPYMTPATGRISNGVLVGWGVPRANSSTAPTLMQSEDSTGLQSLDSHGSSAAGQPQMAAQQVCRQAWAWRT